MKKVVPYLIVLLLGGVIGWLLHKQPAIVKYNTTTLHSVDTLIVRDTLLLTNTISKVDTIHKYHYDTLRFGNKYFTQNFKDSNYNLSTYGGYVDSINLILFPKTIIVHDSTTINNTVNNVQYKPYKNSLGVSYQYYGNNVVSVKYMRNFGMISLGGSVGWMDGINKPIVGLGLSFNFN